MADDTLIKHQILVDEIKKHLGKATFSQWFSEQTAPLSKGDQFIIKMEVNRLLQPSTRVIDLRSYTSSPVQAYEYKNQQHFMDAPAILLFERAIKQHGSYTTAVYEAVMALAEKSKQQAQERPTAERQQANQHTERLVRFASYESRSEERMNYAISVTMRIGNEQVTAKTADISLSGCKLKIAKKYQIAPNEVFLVNLAGLEQDFELGLKQGVQYQVVAIEPNLANSEYYYVRLKRTFVENSPQFDQFLENFINGNKRRYKVNLDNTFEAVITKGHEQYYLPRVNSLFVFICAKQQKWQPTLCLTNENNAEVLHYFSDESRRSVLSSILNPARLHNLHASQSVVKETLLYCFTYNKAGKLYFYSATELELQAKPALRNLFLGFASTKPSWRVFKLQMVAASAKDDHIALSLPSSTSEAISKLNNPPSARVQSYYQHLQQLCLITPLESENLTQHYQQLSYDKSAVNQLKVFGHRKLTSSDLEVVALEYANLRSHKRYLYQTAAQVSTGSQTIGGVTRDFSVLGLQIELSQPVAIKKGDVLHIALPELQKITKKHTLSRIPYEIMAVSKTNTIVNLKAHQKTDEPHAGVLFFTQLIEHNKNKLQVCEEEPKVPGLSKALRNIAIKNIQQTPLYLAKRNGQFTLSSMGLGRHPSHIHHLWQQFGELDNPLSLAPLINDKDKQRVLLPLLHKMNRQQKPQVVDLFIRFIPAAASLNEGLSTRCITSNEDYNALLPFINHGVKKGVVFAFRLFVSRTGRPDTKYLINELKYVSLYALHKAKELEDVLWGVEGVIDALNVDELLPCLFSLPEQEYQTMQARKQQWLAQVKSF